MKFHHLQIIFIPIFLIAMSCKEDKNPIAYQSNQYLGTWCWIKTIGGLFPHVIIPEDGTVITINYDNKNFYKVFNNDTLKIVANYEIEKAEYGRDKISYTNIKTYNYYFDRDIEYAQINSDTLEIWDGVIDGYFSWYIKEK